MVYEEKKVDRSSISRVSTVTML